jgi:hypothetical protein
VGIDGADLTAIADEVLEGHLMSATRFVDTLPFHGDSKHDDNVRRLALPRFSLVVGCGNPHLRRGDTLDHEVVPWVAVDAAIVLAEEERVRGELLWRPSQDRRHVVASRKCTTGGRTFADPLAPRIYPLAHSLLKGLHAGGANSRDLLVVS